MIDNYSETTRALYEFILANAPKGADYGLDCIKRDLAAEPGILHANLYLDFKPSNDTGAALSVRVQRQDPGDGLAMEEDSEGNLWATYRVHCGVSWPSWGTSNLSTCQRRIDVINTVMGFAHLIEGAFPDPFCRLICSKNQRDKRALETLKNQAIDAISDIVRSNCNGMKVGEEKIMPIPGADYTMLEDFDVERWANGRRFKYRASATSREGFSFVRVA